jgi:TonB family protein
MKHAGFETGRTKDFWVCAWILAAVVFTVGISCGRPGQPVGKIYTSEEEGVTAPEVLESPKPAYTEEARSARAEGMVALKGVIRKDGSVDTFEVVKGLGYGLDESAIHTVATQWRFNLSGAAGRLPGRIRGCFPDLLNEPGRLSCEMAPRPACA